METLRKCFGIGFDAIQVFSTVLLAGSEMELPASRARYGLKTRYRVRIGQYGIYFGDTVVVGAEEILRPPSAISGDGALALRPVHWLVWFGWNHGILKPLFSYLHGEFGRNPLDVILDIIHGDKRDFPRVADLFESFMREAAAEWFPSYEAIRDVVALRLRQGSEPEAKVEFRYNARMLGDGPLFDEFCDYLKTVVPPECRTAELSDILAFLRASRVGAEELLAGELLPRHLTVSAASASWLLNKPTVGAARAVFHLPADHFARAKQALLRFGWGERPLYAIEKTLGIIHDAFTCRVTWQERDSGEESETDRHEPIATPPRDRDRPSLQAVQLVYHKSSGGNLIRGG